jgi:hypothetical protein
MSVKIYNSLPIYIKNEINSTKKFESLLKKFLLENSFYSLEKFYNFAYRFISILYFIDLVLTIFHLL